MSADSTNTNCCIETATSFDIEGEPVIGVFHQGLQTVRTGVVFVVGGRQYRTGAQRQFVRLARHLACQGYSAFRFDLRGMGDSAAEQRHFLDTERDIEAAVREFSEKAPWIDRIILFGLCDGASASMCFAAHNHVHSVFMVNPWITTNTGAARTMMKHYYRRQFLSGRFWQRLVKREINIVDSLRSLMKELFQLSRVSRCNIGTVDELDLPSVVFSAMENFRGEVAVVTSDRDLTAREFMDELDNRYSDSGIVFPRSSFFAVKADHTFSSLAEHEELEALTLNWCKRVNSH